MAALKLPSVPLFTQNLCSPAINIPSFDCNSYPVVERIGNGSFGDAYTTKYQAPGSNNMETVVVKKMFQALDNDERKMFAKGVSLLCKLKSDHIVQCKAVCFSPYAMMLEYLYFSFKPFGSDFRVSNLSDLLVHLDSFNCDGFLELIRSMAFEIVEGLSYLHKNGIAHRDLKPANVLVSNQHYDNITNKHELNIHYQSCPVICKLADLGESRSLLVQTQKVLSSRMDKLDRGTVVYIAPEILLPEKQPSKASMGDLMLCDTWYDNFHNDKPMSEMSLPILT